MSIGQITKKDFFVLAEENGQTLSQIAQKKKDAYGLVFLFPEENMGNTIVQGILVKKNFFDLVKELFPTIVNLKVDENTYLFLEGSVRSRVTDDQGKQHVYVVNEGAKEISGRLMNRSDYSPISDAVVYIPDLKKGSTTNQAGSFTVPLSKQYNYLEIQHPGLAKQSIVIFKNGKGETPNLEIELENRENFLDELRVTATKVDANVEDHRAGIQQMSIRTIKQIPTFLGEIDPIRSITTMPGVTSSGDLGAGFNVRGGATSQNLITQDGGLIFNPSHLFGFFSSFNPDLIRSIKLLKGCGPSTYGGRVASVLDLQTRNGEMNKYKVSGGLGLVSSRLSAEGPIKRGRSSFLVSGRTSYSDWLIKKYDNIDLKNSSAKFNDLTGKLFFGIGEEDALSITGYRSFDNFKFSESAAYSWATENFSLNYHHKISKKLSTGLLLASSNYKSSEISDDELFGYINRNQVGVLTASLNFNFVVSEKLKMQWGFQANQYDIRPGSSVPYTDRSQSEVVSIQKQKGLELAGFLENSLEITKNLGMDIGLRYGQFYRYGPGTFYGLNYAEREGREPVVSDSTFFGKNEVAYSKGGAEPRVSLRYKIGRNTSIKMAYARTQQFIQQVSPTISPSPIDYWVLSSNNLKSQSSNQFSVGLFNNFNDNKIEASVEAFYNKTANALDYLDGVNVKLNPIYEVGLAQGIGEAYGLEFFLKKRGGMLNGWISYTYARSWRFFDSPFEGQSINDGYKYPSTFDQPHQLSVVMNIKMPKRVEFSSNITYNTGRPVTIPISKYEYGGLLSVNNYSGRNQYRSPDYMRLDISFTFNGKENTEKKWYSGDFIFSVFNLLARKNPYAIWFDNTGQAFKTSILGTAFPSLTYNFSIN